MNPADYLLICFLYGQSTPEQDALLNRYPQAMKLLLLGAK